jgi:hypothetical protein
MEPVMPTMNQERTSHNHGWVSKRARHLADILIHQITEYDITSAQQWENRVAPEVKLHLIREFGLSVDSYIQRLIKLTKTKNILCIKQLTMSELLREAIYEAFPTIDQTFMSAITWVTELFQVNEIDLVDFMAWNECIKTKRYIKINCVCLEGPTNAGKSLLIDTLIYG